VGLEVDLPIEERRLANGLTVLLLETRTAPVVCLSIWFRAGSRHDAQGRSGTAHLLEHMMFKGTARHPKGDYDRVLHALGAGNNASTWLDRTNYYILIGSDRYATGLELEADRMRGALLRPEDLADERPVVLNELDRNEDDPGVALFDRLLALAFLEHPYRRPVIGWRQDVEAITIEDVRAFYDTYYRPNNAFLTIVGAFERDAMLADLERTFGCLELGTPPPPSPVIEPEQRGERRFELRKAGQQEILGFAYRAPQRAQDDAFALDVLAQVLGHGRTSRLYQVLIESGLAVNASAENQTIPVDPYLFFIDAEPADGIAPIRIEEAIDEEIARLTREPISAHELERARKRARVEFVMRRDSVSALAFLIGELEVSAGWRLAQTYLAQLDAVTADHVLAAAARYLTRDARTIGRFRPTEATA
jgi:zinc protease